MRYVWTSLAASSLLVLAACSQEGKQDADNALSDTGNVFENTATAAGNMVDNAALALTPTPTPQEFVDRAAKSDAFEIAAAELAATNALSAEVKDFAKTMITAHKESTAKIKAAAGAASPAITANAELTADQKEDLAELRALTGAKFDEEYIDGQVDAHEDALDLMRKYSADGGAASLKAAASELAPIVEQHLAHAKRLDKTN
jgi:putative membrane protein